jgi:hypothetical protein
MPTDEERRPSIPIAHAETMLQALSAHDVRGIENIPYDALRELKRWIYGRHPAQRDKYPLRGRLRLEEQE